MVELSVQTKSYLVIGIVLGCFIILYPKIFHPMILSSMGYYKQDPQNDEMLMHPRERMMRGGAASPPSPGKASHHQRPHPGMRMGGSEVRTTGARGGMMGMILPVYAIGIVLYLLYTLMKVFGGNKNDNQNNNNNNQQSRNFAYRYGNAADRDRNRHSVFDDYRGPNGHIGGPTEVENMQQDLEQLLHKVEDRSMSETEMRELRRRLEDTEAQMTRILEQMRSVQNQVQDAVVPQPPVQQATAQNVSDSENEDFGDATSELPKAESHSDGPTISKRTGFVTSDLS